MRVIYRYFSLCLLITLVVVQTNAAQGLTPQPIPAIDGLFKAFDDYPLVAIAEFHGIRQLDDLYIDMIRDPRFAAEVGNIVLEFGNAYYQDVIDQYVNGETVLFEDLERVWTPTFAAGYDPVPYAVYELYAAIRMVNAALPPESRIRVWLGDPPLNPATVPQSEIDAPRDRDLHYARILTDQILAHGKKALVVMGAFHLDPAGFPFLLGNFFTIFMGDTRNVRQIVEELAPRQMYVATVYQGMPNAECATAVESAFAGQEVPAIISLQSTPLVEMINRPECRDYPTQIAEIPEQFQAGWGHGLLYIAPTESLTMSMLHPYEPPVSYLDFIALLAQESE